MPSGVAVAALLILLVPLGGQISVLLSLIVASLLLALVVWSSAVSAGRRVSGRHSSF